MNASQIAAAAILAAAGDQVARAELDRAGLSPAERAELDRAANRVRGTVKRAAIRATGNGEHR